MNETEKLQMFSNRLTKVYRHISRQAKRQQVTCYRIYDHDLPEFPFCIEKYESDVYLAEYKRRHGMTEESHELWLNACLEVIASVLEVERDAIFLRQRQRKEGRQGQYEKQDGGSVIRIVHEAGLHFKVNLSDYLDTGLFLDHRITRQMVRDRAHGKSVLNLFCYTGSFSVYAVAGGASRVDSVDLSKTYLAWAQENMSLNFPSFPPCHRFLHADVKQWLDTIPQDSYDCIVMDPPTFSNSKRMEDFLDIQRDHPALIQQALRLLNPGGELFFSTNYRKFELNPELISETNVKDITAATTPFDFHNKLHRWCYLFRK